MKILFCTDGSRISFSSLANISEWVKEATIDIICIIDWNFLPNEPSFYEENFTCSCANLADTILEKAESTIKSYKFKCGKKIKNCGSVIESILEESQKGKYDLILMGSNGKKGIQKWLGSVSQEIINNSNISNYISKEENKKQKILFTTDGTQCSTSILEEIIPKLNLKNKEIYICMVIEDPNFLFLEGELDSNLYLEIEKEQQNFASESIKDIESIFNKYDIKIHETSILSGIPAQKIIDYSRTNDIDLIILGSKNKTKLDRFLTGSVSKRVLENVVSDIWLARCKN